MASAYIQVDFEKQFRELQKEYIDSLPAKIEDIEQIILGLRDAENPSAEIKKLSMQIHSIKGSAGSHGIDLISTICHNFEDFISGLGIAKIKPSSHLDSFLKFTDLMKEYGERFSVEQDHDTTDYFRQKLSSLVTGRFVKKHRVLIIEYTKTIASQYSKLFEKLEIEVSFANDGYEALGRLVKEKFDSLITVAHSEYIDGNSLTAALRVIRSSNQNIPVIMITADDDYTQPVQFRPDFTLKKNRSLLGELEHTYKEILKKSQDVSQVIHIGSLSRKYLDRELGKILYVDDDVDIQPLIRLGLKGVPDLEIRFSTSGSDALKTLDEFLPDLIILDVVMPEMDGPTLFRKLRKNAVYANIPVIFLTGKDDLSEIRKLEKLGSIGIIRKPFNARNIYDKIKNIWSGAITGS